VLRVCDGDGAATVIASDTQLKSLIFFRFSPLRIPDRHASLTLVQHEEHMLTLETKVLIQGEIITLGEVIEMNELEFDEVADALARDGVYRIDVGSNDVSDFVHVTIARAG
jgi:hypothetical protein